MNRIITCGFFMSLSFVFCPAIDAQSYEVVLARPTKAGATHKIEASGYEHDKMIVTAGDQVVDQKDEEVTVELTASVTVLEVDERGRPARSKLNIDKSTVTRGTATGPLLPPGTEVVVSLNDNKDVYTVGGSPVAEDVGKALSVVYSLPKAKESDDDIFGTREKKKVGDAWQINAELAALSLKDVGLRVNKDDIEGGAALKGVTKVGQAECLDVEAWLNIKSVDLQLPGGFNVVEGRIQAKLAGKFPTDKALGRLEEAEQFSMTLKATGKPDPNGPEVVLDINNSKRSTTRLTYSAPPRKSAGD